MNMYRYSTYLLKFPHWKRGSISTPTYTYTLNIRVTDFTFWWKLDAYEVLTVTGTALCTLAFEFRSHSAISSHAFSIPLRSPWRHKNLAEIQPSWDGCVSLYGFIFHTCLLFHSEKLFMSLDSSFSSIGQWFLLHLGNIKEGKCTPVD